MSGSSHLTIFSLTDSISADLHLPLDFSLRYPSVYLFFYNLYAQVSAVDENRAAENKNEKKETPVMKVEGPKQKD